MTRYKLTIEYMGGGFAGWQRQKEFMSIQQAVEEAIEKFYGKPVTVQAAGRTDAGVHARGQVVHVDLDEFSKPMDEFAILRAINALIRPHTISIIAVEIVPNDFHARFGAVNKLYRYRIVNRAGWLAMDRGLVWHIGHDLDVDAMCAGAKHLLGEHDFTTFRDSECQAKSPIKSIDRLDIETRDYDDHGGHEIIIEVEGQSFLHHMVRNIVGTLSLVGKGKWSPEDVAIALKAKDRTRGGPTAPAGGLCMVRVDY